MKKLFFLCSLISIVIFSQDVYATDVDSNTENTTAAIVSGPVTSSPKATSNASIGFSTKNIPETGGTDNSEGITKPVGRLPSTGETLGMGISILGLLFILIVFRKELKAMIENKKNKSRENV